MTSLARHIRARRSNADAREKGSSMSDSEGYQGWKNYETWAVALWIGNEKGTYETSREMTRSYAESAVDETYATAAQVARYALADALREWVTEDMLPNLEATLAADLLNAAVSEVDWHEIAENYLSDLEMESTS